MPHIKIASTHTDACIQAAHHIASAIKAKQSKGQSFALGLATGNTMEPLYAELVKMFSRGDITFENVHFFNLDEYAGMGADDPRSFNHYLNSLFLKPIHAKADHIHFVQGKDFHPDTYEALIKEKGPIDVQLVGIGSAGHIGFNEKGSTLDSLTRKVKLAETTIEDNASACGGKMHVPSHANTQGIATILRAREILLIGNGGHKAQVIYDMLNDVNNIQSLPARALMHHNNVTIFVDEPAAEMLTANQLQDYTEMCPADAAKLKKKFEPIIIPLGETQLLRLPYNSDIFIPGVMGIDEPFNPQNPLHVKALQKLFKNVKVTYLGAHQDDTEIEVPHEIERNYLAQQGPSPDSNHFLSIIATDGAAYTTALKREGKFAHLTPEALITMRKREQRVAAEKGKFAVIQLQYPSAGVKGRLGEAKSLDIINQMASIYNALPQHHVAYCHAPVDTHETHVAVLALATEALRMATHKPKEFYGMEGWGELGIGDKVFQVENPDLIGKLLHSYVSQIEMQKRPYDEIAVSRIRGNSFMGDHHAEAKAGGMVIGIDLSEAIKNGSCESLSTIVADAFKKTQTHACAMLHRFAAPGSAEANPTWEERTDKSARTSSGLIDNGQTR